MPDPYVPTGRELESGEPLPEMPQSPKRGSLLRRLMGGGRERGGRSPTDVELHLAKEVGEKLPRGARPRPSEQSPTLSKGPKRQDPGQVPRHDDQPSRLAAGRGDLEFGTSLEDRQPPLIEPSPGRAAPASAAPHDHSTLLGTANHLAAPSRQDWQVSSEVVAAMILLARHPRPEIAWILDAPRDHPLSESEIRAIEWWSTLNTEDIAEPPGDLLIESPEGVDLVIEWIRTEETGADRLIRFQRQSDAWDRADQTLELVRRRARSFSSLDAVVACLERRDIEGASVRVDYGSAAWHECRGEISAAMSHLQVALHSGPPPLAVRLPRRLPGQSNIYVALYASFCTRSSIEKRGEMARELIQVEGPDGAASLLMEWSQG